jgi:excisionase family DNA binding protein
MTWRTTEFDNYAGDVRWVPMHTSPEGELILVQEAADRLAVSRWLVYRLIWDQQVASVQIGRCRRMSDRPSTIILPG